MIEFRLQRIEDTRAKLELLTIGTRLELLLRIDEVRLNFNTMQEYTPLDDQMHRTTDYGAVYYHVLYTLHMLYFIC